MMPYKQLNRSSGAIVATLAMGLGIVLVLYALSIGPAYRAMRLGYVSQPTLETVYAPFIWIDGKSGFLTELGNWYMGLWF